MTPAEICKERGWKVGDILEATYYVELDRPEYVCFGILRYHKKIRHYAVIKVIGEFEIWCRFKSGDGPQCFHGGCYAIDPVEQDWSKVGTMDPFPEKLIWPRVTMTSTRSGDDE